MMHARCGHSGETARTLLAQALLGALPDSPMVPKAPQPKQELLQSHPAVDSITARIEPVAFALCKVFHEDYFDKIVDVLVEAFKQDRELVKHLVQCCYTGQRANSLHREAMLELERAQEHEQICRDMLNHQARAVPVVPQPVKWRMPQGLMDALGLEPQEAPADQGDQIPPELLAKLPPELHELASKGKFVRTPTGGTLTIG
jgi:hypothetical protein